MFEFIQKGGPVMYPIMLCSVIAFGIILERLYYFHKMKINTITFMSNIENALKRNKIADAVKICESAEGPVVRIVKVGLLKHDRPRQEIKVRIIK